MAGGNLLVGNAVKTAVALEMAPAVTGLTTASIGTTMTELKISLPAVREGKSDLAGKIIVGSDIAYVLAALLLVGGARGRHPALGKVVGAGLDGEFPRQRDLPVMCIAGQGGTGNSFRGVTGAGGQNQVQMNPLAEMLLWTMVAGVCIPIGAALAHVEHVQPPWLDRALRHSAIAFGGGVLVGAVALVLVPEGSERISYPLAAVALVGAGGMAFMMLERLQARLKSTTPLFVAMAADFLPESLALGGMFVSNAEGAVLLALLMGLQNLPEGFNAWRELSSGLFKQRTALLLIGLVVFLGPVFGLVGWYWLTEYDAVLGAVMLFASGGILYLTFQDIAPQSRMKNRWEPPLGAVLGFALALAAELAL